MSRSDDDDTLMEELGDSLRGAGDVPQRWRDAAQAAFAWRSVDRDLLMLVQEGELAGAAVRGEGDRRVLSFSGGGVSLELEADDRRIVGQVLPPRECRVTIEGPGEQQPVAAVADTSGLFTIDWRGRGPVRFVVELDGANRRTEWVVL
ncbi:hypothetical protein Kfla_4188 [Kribbella flavida DSM 17836]|uniref:Uncharacterized protein n=1 Tax=Kribbella flavida (strain DSM 17836 / JCM 10339 / NBRC 14399) TaxID=479435 RepID=D2PTU9_KRIFD|nr:hypothetical protein [Kribbella flavida]ADB33232.1 hypothetical protein Kfla_4188 [Kribbella flavida DSM 17836]